MPSYVCEFAALSATDAESHFSRKLAFETDCWDVHASMVSGNVDFVLLDVRGPKPYARGHVPGALNLPHGKILQRRMEEWPSETVFVVYCAGPHCNGADKAALKLSKLGRRAKLMIGGVTGWVDEAFALATGSAPGSVKEVELE